MPGRAGLSGFILDSYFSILSILPARAKLFSEDWLILSENVLSMPSSFFYSIKLAAFQASGVAHMKLHVMTNDPPAERIVDVASLCSF
jgi:hypothetical protein